VQGWNPWGHCPHTPSCPNQDDCGYTRSMGKMMQYFAAIKPGKTVLWCYLIWYLVTVFFHFDPSPKLWLNSLGISAVIGTGLILSVSSNGLQKQDPWQTFRLYLMPFCVSSFSALIKDKGFILVVAPSIWETGIAIAACTLFLLFIYLIKHYNPRPLR